MIGFDILEGRDCKTNIFKGIGPIEFAGRKCLDNQSSLGTLRYERVGQLVHRR